MSESFTINTGINIDTSQQLELGLNWQSDPNLNIPALTTQDIQLLNLNNLLLNNTYSGNNSPTLTTINPHGTYTPNSQSTGNVNLGSTYDNLFVTHNEFKNLITKELEPVKERLAILDHPDPRVLEKFESLRSAYEHYRTMEALMYDEIQRIKNPE